MIQSVFVIASSGYVFSWLLLLRHRRYWYRFYMHSPQISFSFAPTFQEFFPLSSFSLILRLTPATPRSLHLPSFLFLFAAPLSPTTTLQFVATPGR